MKKSKFNKHTDILYRKHKSRQSGIVRGICNNKDRMNHNPMFRRLAYWRGMSWSYNQSY